MPKNPFKDCHLDTNVMSQCIMFRSSTAYGLRDRVVSKVVRNLVTFYMGDVVANISTTMDVGEFPKNQ